MDYNYNYQQENQFQDNQNQQSNGKKSKLMLLGIGVFVIALVGVTYAFFNYTRTGTSNNIRVGKIAFSSNQTETINLTNVFPISSTQAATDTTNTDEAVITITGDTTYPNGVEYIITATDVSNTVGTGANAKTVPIAIEVTASNGLGTADANYFDNRGSTTSVYKVLSDGKVTDDGNLVVGYIAAGQTGINGTVTIKAYLDASSIAVSDTYDESDPGTDNMGTTSEWIAGRTVFTTNEWNALQANGVSFKVKVEANEGVWVDEVGPSLYDVLDEEDPPLDSVNSANVQNISTENLNTKVTFLDNVENQGKVIRLSAGIDFSQPSSDTNGQGLYMRGGTENDTYPIYYYRGNVDNNNVAFAGFCWQIVRTTETGGIKLLYNGVQDENGACTPLPTSCASGESSCEASDEASEETDSDKRYGEQIFIRDGSQYKFQYNSGTNNSYALTGYMYGTPYPSGRSTWSSDSGNYFGSGFTYNNGVYTLTGATVTKPDATHHYSCNSTDPNATCNELLFVYSFTDNANYKMFEYVKLTGGVGIEEAIVNMQTNTNDSDAKVVLDNWYEDNLLAYSNKIEDTIWCNDRSISEIGGWSSTGEIISTAGYYTVYLIYSGQNRYSTTYIPSLTCSQPNDRFTVSSSNGNGALTYPVGLITIDELMLAGYSSGNLAESYIHNTKGTWTMTPCVKESVKGTSLSGRLSDNSPYESYGLRPMISLKHAAIVLDNGADGTLEHPYTVK